MDEEKWQELTEGCPAKFKTDMVRCAMTKAECKYGHCAVWFMALILFNRLVGNQDA